MNATSSFGIERSMAHKKKTISTANYMIILITFLLFALALFTKGFTHDLLLETGVFLVSVKLILMAYSNKLATASIVKKLDEVKKTVCD